MKNVFRTTATIFLQIVITIPTISPLILLNGQEVSASSATEYSSEFQYDANGNVSQITKPDGTIITHEYDSENRLTRKTYTGGLEETFSYGSQGQILSAINGTSLLLKLG